jgi:hypothetical protein
MGFNISAVSEDVEIYVYAVTVRRKRTKLVLPVLWNFCKGNYSNGRDSFVVALKLRIKAWPAPE